MAKLHFRYAAMNAGKSTALLQVAHNYETLDKCMMLVKPAVDLKGGDRIVSRLGVESPVDFLWADGEPLPAEGADLDDAMSAVLAALRGRAMLAHFAYIERHFLSRLCERLYGAPLVVPVVCTLVLHDSLVNRGFDDEARAGQLRLWTARARYGLPSYPAHDALVDALACAELYLAQTAELGQLRTLSLGAVATR